MKEMCLREKLEKGELVTPSYIFDMDVLSAHIDKIRDIAAGHVSLCYAMKANPFLVRNINRQISKIEVCSPGELQICSRYHIPGNNIIFSGVNKTEKDIEEAFAYGVSVITIESQRQFDFVIQYVRENHTATHVLLRLTSGSQFGMDEGMIEHIIACREEYPQITIDGIHFFSGTQKKKALKIQEELQYLQHFLDTLKEIYQYQASVLEFGAGLSVPYFEGEDFEGIYNELSDLVKQIDAMHFKAEVTLELGRYFAYNCGQYITRVEDCKNNGEHFYAIVDGGIHQVNYYGQNMAMRVPLITHLKIMQQKKLQSEKKEWTICGSLCTFADVLVRKVSFSDLEFGDYLIFQNTGAYSVTESPTFFLSRRMPGLYSYNSVDGLHMMRNALESFEWNHEKDYNEAD